MAPPHSVFSSVKALHIIMVVKESVNNAVKHSGGDKIIVTGSVSGNQMWNLQVADNGKGFNPGETDKNLTNGLQNISDRSVSGHFETTLEAGDGQGTTVTLVIPLQL